MHPATAAAVDRSYARVFGVDEEDLWCDLTVRTHRRLGDYPGWYVAWRGDGVHVSSPADAPAVDAGMLAGCEIPELQDVAFWRRFADERGLRLVGPATHTSPTWPVWNWPGRPTRRWTRRPSRPRSRASSAPGPACGRS
ncbi:MAG: hypothetical protein JHD04_05880, partial [Nocardioides sp.]|nr:hypothetical protein [Nocardioides sp.]